MEHAAVAVTAVAVAATEDYQGSATVGDDDDDVKGAAELAAVVAATVAVTASADVLSVGGQVCGPFLLDVAAVVS